MEHISLSAELGEIRYAIEGAHWIADSVAVGAVPDPDRTHSAPVNQSLFEKHPWIDDHLRRWQSVLKLTCAFAMYAVEAENMKEPLSPREMEAVALVIALRPPEQEFERDEKTPAQRKENWKKLMKEARKDVLPLLRQLAAEHHPAVQDAVRPSGPPVQPAVSALSTPTAPPKQTTTTSPEQSGAAGGDKR